MTEALKREDGTLWQFTLKVAGKPFYCRCGCNVFHKPDIGNLDKYRCNACGLNYESVEDDEL